MIQSNGDTIPVMVIGTAFTQDKNSTYVLQGGEKLIQLLKDGTATVSYPGLPDTIAELIGGQIYGLVPGITQITCNQKFNLGN